MKIEVLCSLSDNCYHESTEHTKRIIPEAIASKACIVAGFSRQSKLIRRIKVKRSCQLGSYSRFSLKS